MRYKIYQVDAFTDQVFSGNPAAVCPLEQWLSDDVMQKIAMENNLAETAFIVKENNQYQIRWFTPTVEVDLCGHATLAAAYVLFEHENYNGNIIHFYSPRSGELKVSKEDDYLILNFPSDNFTEVELSNDLLNCFDIKSTKAFKGKTDYMIIFEKEVDVRNVIPNYNNIYKLDSRGIIITSKGEEVDFVSRFFAPQSGIDEDPVTGSAHTTLIPYWSKELDKNTLSAIQLSSRKGYLMCKHLNERVEIGGQAKLYLIGELFLD